MIDSKEWENNNTTHDLVPRFLYLSSLFPPEVRVVFVSIYYNIKLCTLIEVIWPARPQELTYGIFSFNMGDTFHSRAYVYQRLLNHHFHITTRGKFAFVDLKKDITSTQQLNLSNFVASKTDFDSMVFTGDILERALKDCNIHQKLPDYDTLHIISKHVFKTMNSYAWKCFITEVYACRWFVVGMCVFLWVVR